MGKDWALQKQKQQALPEKNISILRFIILHRKSFSMLRYFLAFVTLSFVLASCKTTHEPYRAHYKELETQDITDKQVIQTPVIVDLDVTETKVSGSFSAENVQVEYAKNKALADAIAKSGADVLVEPVYEVDINDKTVTATVQGYPGKYKNFRKPQPQDSLLLRWRNSGTVSGSSIVRKEKPHFDERMLVSNTSKCDAMRSTGKILTYTGAGLLIAGAGLVVGGAYYSKHEGEDKATIPMMALGGVIAATGVFLVPFGVTLTKKAKVCDSYNGHIGEARLNFEPQLNPLQSQYAMSMRVQF